MESRMELVFRYCSTPSQFRIHLLLSKTFRLSFAFFFVAVGVLFSWSFIVFRWQSLSAILRIKLLFNAGLSANKLNSFPISLVGLAFSLYFYWCFVGFITTWGTVYEWCWDKFKKVWVSYLRLTVSKDFFLVDIFCKQTKPDKSFKKLPLKEIKAFHRTNFIIESVP